MLTADKEKNRKVNVSYMAPKRSVGYQERAHGGFCVKVRIFVAGRVGTWDQNVALLHPLLCKPSNREHCHAYKYHIKLLTL